jgi:hypothetical protein
MDENGRDSRSMSNGHSFSNGNGPPDDGPQMEGWVLRPVHWWLM